MYTIRRMLEYRSAAAKALMLPVFAVLAACAQDAGMSDATVYEGARVIIGDGSVIENGAFAVEAGQITAVGTAGDVSVAGAATVDLSGMTVMPAIIDTHVHMNITREELLNDLRRRAYFGVAAAMSMGSDVEGTPLEMQDEVHPGHARFVSAGTGITRPEPGRRVVHWINTVAEAREAVRTEAARGVDVVKIWVDDRNGQFEKLTPELYGAVIDEAHQNDIRVSAHIFEQEDGKGLLRAGVDIFAHGVRDRDIDAEFIRLVNANPNVVLIPNLPGRGVPADYSWLEGAIPAADLQQLQSMGSDPQAQAAFGIQAAQPGPAQPRGHDRRDGYRRQHAVGRPCRNAGHGRVGDVGRRRDCGLDAQFGGASGSRRPGHHRGGQERGLHRARGESAR